MSRGMREGEDAMLMGSSCNTAIYTALETKLNTLVKATEPHFAIITTSISCKLAGGG